jgi:molybdopterin-containing oxidoreductase family iron-sulfur binding subunit
MPSLVKGQTDRREPRIDLAAIQSRLRNDGGRKFWRSLDELAGSPRYQEFLDHEFPHDPEKEEAGATRRDLLKLMAASAALAGLTGCTKLPTQKIVPYVRAPEEIVPGRPLFYATAMPLGGIALGLLVESHMGRPTKTEGNPQHPASLGATDAFAQASLLTLYDPDRSRAVTYEGRIANWDFCLADLRKARDALRPSKGDGLRILTETVTSPTLGWQIQTLLAQLPAAKWHQYEPCGRDAAREGARLAFGEYVNTVYRLDQADVILALDADFLCSGPGSVRYARDFAARRSVDRAPATMNRLYVVESTPSNTGAMADHRAPLRSRDIEHLARAVANQLGLPAGQPAPAELPREWIAAVARDLDRHRGRSLVVAGDQQPPAVHALAHALNEALGNFGKTVICTDPLEVKPVDQMASLRELAADMQAGRVKMLVILGGNPVYTAPSDLEFAKRLLGVPLRVHLSPYEDETSQLCHWHIPETHFLEAWGDARAYDGTVTIMQPLIAPLYDGKSAHELLSVLLGPETPCHDVVKTYWKNQYNAMRRGSAAEFEPFWETSLHDGVVAGTALGEKRAAVRKTAAGVAPEARVPETAGSLEIVFRPDPTSGTAASVITGGSRNYRNP